MEVVRVQCLWKEGVTLAEVLYPVHGGPQHMGSAERIAGGEVSGLGGVVEQR